MYLRSRISLSRKSCFYFKILPSLSSLFPCQQTTLKTVPHMEKIPWHSHSPGYYPCVPTVLTWGQTYLSPRMFLLLAEEVTEIKGGLNSSFEWARNSQQQVGILPVLSPLLEFLTFLQACWIILTTGPSAPSWSISSKSSLPCLAYLLALLREVGT